MSRDHLNRACKNKPKYPKAPKRDLSKTFKSNFNKVVKNNALKSRKPNYNPEIDTNWCNLPMEMRYECVKRMDFKTRCRFRRTSRTEKSLVDSKKYQFEHFKIVLVYPFQWRVIAKKGPESCQPEVFSENRDDPDYECIAAILKHAEVKNFKFMTHNYYGARVLPVLEHMEKFAPFRFETVSVFDDSSLGFFIKNCPNLEKVDFCAEYRRYPFNEIIETPSLMNIKKFQFTKMCSVNMFEFLKGLVQKWIDNDAGIGKSIQFKMKKNLPFYKTSISAFAEKFPGRVIEKTEREVRFRMNKNTTQILFRLVGFYHNEIPIGRRIFLLPGRLECCSCKVIPIDMPKSEYGKGDKWIQALYENILFKRGKLKVAAEFDAEDEEVWGREYMYDE